LQIFAWALFARPEPVSRKGLSRSGALTPNLVASTPLNNLKQLFSLEVSAVSAIVLPDGSDAYWLLGWSLIMTRRFYTLGDKSAQVLAL